MKIPVGATLLFNGDSITDAGRGRPVGRGDCETLGSGYVSFVNALLTARHPERAINILNTGVSGDTARHLKARWTQDVLNLKPDWLSVMIGINDVWRQFDSPLDTSFHVHPKEYDSTLRELIASTKVRRLVLMTPYFIEINKSDAMRRMMDEYSAIVRKIAGEAGAILVDTQAAFDEVLKVLPSAALAGDRVHPGAAGHMILARAFLKAVGFEL
jgi:lysophospholipase L1-like esterase